MGCFLESEADHLTNEWLELADSVKQQTVNSLQLRPFESYLQQKMNAEVHCELIPYARNTTEQFEILSRLAQLLCDGEDVILDVTHGFRHLPMLALVAARFLKKTKNIKRSNISKKRSLQMILNNNNFDDHMKIKQPVFTIPYLLYIMYDFKTGNI